jgi:hypothetical protein
LLLRYQIFGSFTLASSDFRQTSGPPLLSRRCNDERLRHSSIEVDPAVSTVTISCSQPHREHQARFELRPVNTSTEFVSIVILVCFVISSSWFA